MLKQRYREAGAIYDRGRAPAPLFGVGPPGQLMSAYTYYMANKYDESLVALQRFLSLHPGNKDAPYAYYLTALCYYEQISDVRREFQS